MEGATSTQDAPKALAVRRTGRMPPIGRLSLTLVVGAVGGTLADLVALPLAWMIGPLIACAGFAVAGIRMVPVPYGREIGQAVVGVAIGLKFTAPVLMATLAMLPAMAASSLYVIAVTTFAAVLFRGLGRVDRKTAFFATAAAGMADMALIARERGGDADAVSVVHAIRVASVVTSVPLLVGLVGGEGSFVAPNAPAAATALDVAVLLAAGVAGAFLIRPLKLPNPWLLGPIFVGAGLAAADLLVVSMPYLLIVLAQLMIGIALGCRFRRELLARLPRVVLAGLAIAAFMIAAAGIGAAVLSQATGLDLATSFLALAPAGAAEMVLTAKVMNLDTATVTAFHVMRIAVIATTILLVFNLFDRMVRWADESRV